MQIGNKRTRRYWRPRFGQEGRFGRADQSGALFASNCGRKRGSTERSHYGHRARSATCQKRPKTMNPGAIRRKKRDICPCKLRKGILPYFLQKAAMEISFEGEKYLIVPQASILVVIRESDTVVGEDEVLDELEGLDDLDL